MFKAINQFVNARFQKWLDRRIHKTRAVELNQRRVFIFPSRQGIFFGVTIATLFIGGINYSNSLIMSVCFLLSSMFVVTILYTFRNLAGLEVSAGRTENTFAGENALFTVRLTRLFDRPFEAIDLIWEGGVTEKVDLIEGSQIDVEMMVPTNRRGLFQPNRLKLETTFPLGLLRSWAWVDLDTSCLVYPKPIANDRKPDEVDRGREEGEKVIPRGVEDFEMLRNYQQGDSLKHVDWKSYARTDELYTKSFIDYADDHTWLDWQTFGDGEPELKLSQLCYWVLKLSEKHVVFGLKLPGLTIDPGFGEKHKLECLTALARF